MLLPPDFINYTSALFGEERWQRYLASFDEPVPVSIRINPYKEAPLVFPPTGENNDLLNCKTPPLKGEDGRELVPWSRNACYLSERPNFTLDPLLHAGAYYVQEASSMFLDYIMKSLSTLNHKLSTALDLCAAPGGKSTLLRAALPDEATLYSNEPDRKRANILMENMLKQGHPRVVVTNNYPADYARTGKHFDLILTDVPCSGEGMFRKDSATISEWSMQNVLKCQALQRSIVEEAWKCLNPGGVLIYSTCTFNTRENEENVRWIIDQLGAEIIPMPVNPEWHITGSLLPGFNGPVYRFIPGITRGEGLFMAVLRKPCAEPAFAKSGAASEKSKNSGTLRILSDGNPQPVVKGKNVIPSHAEALLLNTPKDKYPRVELSHDEALRYLRHEALLLPPDAPRGYVIVTYAGLPLGFVKNIGSRANNLYPKEWKIRNL